MLKTVKASSDPYTISNNASSRVDYEQAKVTFKKEELLKRKEHEKYWAMKKTDVSISQDQKETFASHNEQNNSLGYLKNSASYKSIIGCQDLCNNGDNRENGFDRKQILKREYEPTTTTKVCKSEYFSQSASEDSQNASTHYTSKPVFDSDCNKRTNFQPQDTSEISNSPSKPKTQIQNLLNKLNIKSSFLSKLVENERKTVQERDARQLSKQLSKESGYSSSIKPSFSKSTSSFVPRSEEGIVGSSTSCIKPSFSYCKTPVFETSTKVGLPSAAKKLKMSTHTIGGEVLSDHNFNTSGTDSGTIGPVRKKPIIQSLDIGKMAIEGGATGLLKVNVATLLDYCRREGIKGAKAKSKKDELVNLIVQHKS